MPSLVRIGPEVPKEKIKMRKVYDDNYNANDNDDRKRKHFDQKRSHEPVAQLSL